MFLTVCTRGRRPWLASAEVHELLVDVWKGASAWLVGRYVLMPDHVHLFAGLAEEDVPPDDWVRYWKSMFSKRHGIPQHRWQAGYWDRRLLRAESYDEKWEYVRLNPVRHGLVARAEDWPFQGEINVLPW